MKDKQQKYGYFTCTQCNAKYWYPREYPHRDMSKDHFEYIPNPGLCDPCLAKKKQADHKNGCVVPWDGEIDGLMSLEDDEPQDESGQGLLFV